MSTSLIGTYILVSMNVNRKYTILPYTEKLKLTTTLYEGFTDILKCKGGFRTLT